MDTEKVIQDLNRRFAAPLPEFYQRRIIFWYDEDREFEDKLDEITLDNATLVQLTGNNTFAVKKLLCEDDITGNYLVYQPLSFSRDDDNWLINVQLYSEEFHADLNSIWIDEMGLPATPIIRKQVKAYRKFFNAKNRRDDVAKLNNNITTAAQMHLAVMAALCGNADTQPNGILRAVINAGLEKDTNDIYQKFVNFGAENAFWAMAAQATGYNGGNEPSLVRLVATLLITAATRTMHTDLLAGLDNYISLPHQAYCYDLVAEWMHSSDSQQLYELARIIEEKARLRSRFEKFAVEDLIDTECFPCINECILTSLMTEISNQIIRADAIKKTVEKRRTFAWYEEVSCYYDGLLAIAKMQQFFLDHSAGFHTVEPHKIWNEYTSDYYRMDTYYRQFHNCFQKSLKVSNPLLDDLFKQVTEQTEGLYSHWFLGSLGQNWSTACADSLRETGRISEVPQQEEFYRNYVKTSDSRVFVIISDALRYEVAASLAEQLERETRSKVKLSSCEAIFPTATKYGMAALLPHKKLDAKLRGAGDLAVLADGSYTDAGYREKILKNANQNSVVLKYDSLIGMKRDERTALAKGMEVVYIYHDKVDESSHVSDAAVFPACDEAITEIKNLVRIIVNDMNGTKIYITADHGFLYTYSPLSEDGKVDKTSETATDVEVDRRYLIAQKGAAPEYLLPVCFINGETDYDAFAARENVRIRKKGGGLNYVHGGISLQEMVVPVVEYKYLHTNSKDYTNNKARFDTKPVQLNLLSANRKLCNMIFSLDFHQTEPVGGNREAANYELYFTDAGNNRISDTCRIIADKTSDNSKERTFRCNFNLKSLPYDNRAAYYLVIADESGLQMPKREEFQIDIAFALGEFDFF